MERTITDDLDALLAALPPHLIAPLKQRDDNHELLEIVMDLGRLPSARYPGREVVLGNVEVTHADLDYVIERIGDFGDDNRAGIERTLHRISCIRNRAGRVVGLTCRVGRAVFGTIQLIEDLVQSGKSILLLGRPGVGKTTMLRETARVLADDLNKRVIIVDTSNEIAGDGDIPHPAIGSARRMQVRTPSAQHATMIEAVENHMPEVVVIDEIGTELEAQAARTIAERGVQLVGTAHGNALENLMQNPTLSDLVGGIQSVTLGDEEARRRGTQKSILERKAPPTFDIVVEIQSWDRVALHPDVAETVDALLRGFVVNAELREMRPDGTINSAIEERGELAELNPFENRAFSDRRFGRRGSRHGNYGQTARPAPAPPPQVVPDNYAPIAALESPPQEQAEAQTRTTRIYPFGISRSRLEQAIRETRVAARVVDSLDEADTVFTLNSYFRRKPPALRDAEDRHIPLSVLRSNAVSQIERMLISVTQQQQPARRSYDPEFEALREAEDAINDIRVHGEASVQLPPQPSYIRRKQHELAQRFNLTSVSRGREPHRGVRIFAENPRSR
ncbi:MAG TPA: R3H domain-containing nucleic acid-binding protein [Dehalococcoidia bacterium]|nr:R3H domain-containing nucleic acid-binding protein [Dehalococcoidia bacterium]